MKYSVTEDIHYRTETRDGMQIHWQIPIQMDDGVVLRADLFRPMGSSQVPVIMSYGCYAKGQAFQEAYKPQWDSMVDEFPEIERGSSNKYQCWELTDPERWIPEGYAVLRVDSRGAGWSPGIQDLWSAREAQDYCACIDWAGEQTWCDGNVGLLGISYYAANQWLAAAARPRHLKAIIPWEGASDCYRELYYHGGIRCTFLDSWLPRQVAMQYGQGERSRRNPVTGEPCGGDVTLSDSELATRRVDKCVDVKAHALLDNYYRPVITDFDKVEVAVLSSANWGGQGLHLRGNVEGFTRSKSSDKYLEVHGLEHWTHFYTDYGLDLQKRFFGRYLKGDATGWRDQPRVQLQIRHINHFEQRSENEWPLARTQWTRWHLDAANHHFSTQPAESAASLSFTRKDDGLTFMSEPFREVTELTGSLSAQLSISSTTADADVFVVLTMFDPQGQEVAFRGAMDAYTPLAQGWLRASHREIDPVLSTPERPFHPHEQLKPLKPGEIVQLDVEIWPTCIVIPAGYSLALQVRGRDYEYGGPVDARRNARHRYPSRGCGPFRHDTDEDSADNKSDDRAKDDFNGVITLHTGPSHPCSVLLPIIPQRSTL